MKRGAILTFLLALSLARVAHAQNDAATEARTQSQTGLDEYRAGHFREAANAFRRAYEITHDVQLLLNLGNALYQAGDLRAAKETFNQYLSLATSDLRDRPYVVARLQEIDARIEVETARARPIATRTVTRVMVRTVEQPPPSSRVPIFVLELAVTAAGVMAMTVGGAFWLDAGNRYEACALHPCALADEPRGQEAAGVALFWSGTVITALGATFFAITATRPRARAHVARTALLDAVRLGVHPHGGLSVEGRF